HFLHHRQVLPTDGTGVEAVVERLFLHGFGLREGGGQAAGGNRGGGGQPAAAGQVGGHGTSPGRAITGRWRLAYRGGERPATGNSACVGGEDCYGSTGIHPEIVPCWNGC